MAARFALKAERWSAEIAPEIGGSVLSLSLDGRAVLRPTPEEAVANGEVRRTACYALVPYANRIALGRFCIGGANYALRQNFPDSAHPLHGVGWHRRWRIAGADSHRCELRLEHRPRDEDRLDWPFAFDAVQWMELDANGLSVHLSVANAGDAPAPLGLGLHPLFPRQPAQTLTFESAGVWLNGADGLPVEQVSGSVWDYSAGRAIAGESVDNDFYGWDGCARIDARDGLRISIAASRLFSMLRVFTPAGRDFFGVEPVSHLTNAINRAALQAGAMYLAPPGGRIEGAVTIGAVLPP